MKHLVGHSQNNIAIYIDLTTSNAVKNIARQPHLLTLATEVLKKKKLTEKSIIIENDMSRTIGYNYIIETDDDSTVFYARLVHDAIYTRFTKKGKPEASSFLTMSLELDENGSSYDLRNVWIGHFRPSRPGSDDETADSLAFWRQHAVIFQNHPIQASTLTKTCPY